jgi:hypothetical protein
MFTAPPSQTEECSILFTASPFGSKLYYTILAHHASRGLTTLIGQENQGRAIGTATVLLRAGRSEMVTSAEARYFSLL